MFIVQLIEATYNFLWGDLFQIPLPGGGSIGISLLIIFLVPAAVYFTIRTRFMQLRLFPDMVRALTEQKSGENGLSPFQTLIVSTATRVGMGNLVGVVAAISAGGAGAVFWMWIMAVLGSATAFIEATLAQLYKEKDPLYGGYRGGPAYYIHRFFERKEGRKKRYVLPAVLFAISGLICWCGISQVISNSVSESFNNAFNIPPLYTTIALVILAAVIVLRKNATVKVLDVLVPVMAVLYFVITLIIIGMNITALPGVFQRIFEEAFGIRQFAGGSFGAILMNGVKRGLFSNEAGSGSAPCAAAAADEKEPVKMGLIQALGVFIDTIVICSLTGLAIAASGMLGQRDPRGEVLNGTALMIAAFSDTFGRTGEWMLTISIVLFAFATIIAWEYQGEKAFEYLTGGCDRTQWYRLGYGLVTFLGAVCSLEAVWDFSDICNGLMAVPNLLAVLMLSRGICREIRKYNFREI